MGVLQLFRLLQVTPLSLGLSCLPLTMAKGAVVYLLWVPTGIFSLFHFEGVSSPFLSSVWGTNSCPLGFQSAQLLSRLAVWAQSVGKLFFHSGGGLIQFSPVQGWRGREFGAFQHVGPLQLAQAPIYSLCLVCAVHWRTMLALWRWTCLRTLLKCCCVCVWISISSWKPLSPETGSGCREVPGEVQHCTGQPGTATWGERLQDLLSTNSGVFWSLECVLSREDHSWNLVSK